VFSSFTTRNSQEPHDSHCWIQHVDHFRDALYHGEQYDTLKYRSDILIHANNISVDPEMKAEFEERQKSTSSMTNPAANPLQNFDAAAWLSGASTKSESKRVEAPRAGERGVTR
jgi:hypothetical protein